MKVKRTQCAGNQIQKVGVVWPRTQNEKLGDQNTVVCKEFIRREWRKLEGFEWLSHRILEQRTQDSSNT